MQIMIGVMADTHGSAYGIERAVLAAGDVDIWFHLGDVLSDAKALESRTGKPVYRVRGNCDFSDIYPSENTVEIGGVRILFTHGHTLGVKYGIDSLFYRAEELNCDIALFGHTHAPTIEASGKLLAVNPGSPSNPRSGYAPSIAILRIENGEVYPSICPV